MGHRCTGIDTTCGHDVHDKNDGRGHHHEGGEHGYADGPAIKP